MQVCVLERFSNDCRKTKTKLKTPTNHNGSKLGMNQTEVLAITCNLLKAREKSRVEGAIGFGFTFSSLVEYLARNFSAKH